jgi:protein-disulfide isomerase
MQARTTQKSPLAGQQRTILIVGIIAVIAVIIAVIAIVISNNGAPTASGTSYSTVPQERLDDGGFVLGNPEAPVTIVEFADFACPHCQAYFSTTQRFIDEFVVTGKARFEYRMFISGADPVHGTYTAQLAECAGTMQDGGFWTAHDILFELGNRGRFNTTTARTLADRMGLSYSDLLSCAQDAKQYTVDMNLGEQLGVRGTPTVMVRINDEMPQVLPNESFESLKAIVESVQ